MKRSIKIVVLLTTAVLFVSLSIATSGQSIKIAKNGDKGDSGNGNSFGLDELKRIERGFEIAPVPLDFRRKDRNLVGLGSYIVNAQAACADCHSCPTYAPGHNPFQGGDGAINGNEQCDGTNLNGFTCEALGNMGGTLQCDPVTCTFDTQLCEVGGGDTSGGTSG